MLPQAIGRIFSSRRIKRHSIVLRSFGVTIAFVLGHSLGYALMLAANHLLEPTGFGFFYAAWTAITVTMGPATAIFIVLGRVLTSSAATDGRESVIRLTRRLLRTSVLWGAPAAVLLGTALAGAGSFLPRDTTVTLVLIPFVILALILVELLRTSFQALLLFGLSSMLWLASQSVQVSLAIPALALWHSTSAGFAAVLAGAVIACISFIPWFVRAPRQEGGVNPSERLPLQLRREVRLVASYSLFLVISNMDILVGYWTLPGVSFSSYAASAILPKAIVLATFPVAQIVLPVIVEQKAGGLPSRQSGLTAVALALAMGGAAALALWLVVPPMQSTPIAIHGLDFSVMKILTLGSVGLGAARVLVTAEIALGRYSIGYVEALAIAIFAALAIVGGDASLPMATIYTAVCWIFFAAAGATLLSSALRPRFRQKRT